MLSLELLQNIRLPLLITSHPTCLLLPLIIHHLLDHRPRLAVQIAQARILRGDLADVDLRRTRHDMRPPLHLIHLVQMNRHLLARRLGRRLQRPR